MTNTKSGSAGKKLFSGSVLRVGNLFGAALASFFLMPLIVHHLGDRVYGFWSLASAFIGYYNLLDLGLSSAVSQYMCIALGRKDDAECRIVFNTALALQLMIGLAALVATAGLALATPWFCHEPAAVPLFRKVIVILGINAALGFPARIYWAVLESELRFDIQSWIALMNLVMRTGLIIWVIFAGGGLLELSWVTLISTIPAIALQVWFARRQATWARVDRRFALLSRVRSFFSYSVYSFMAYVADVVRFQLDPLVISALIGLVAVTHYKVAGILAQYYMQIISVSVGTLLPVFSRLHGAGNRSDLEEAFFFGTKISCCLSVFIALILTGWGRPFIARWMGPSYQDGYLPLVVLSLAVLIDTSQRSSMDLLYATFNHRFYAWTNCAEAVLNLGFSILLARPLGILGVALGTLIGAFTIRAIVQPWWVCRVSNLHYTKFVRFLAGNMLRALLVAAASLAVVVWGLRPSYPLLIASVICSAAVYAAGSWLLIFNRAERNRFIGIFRRNDLAMNEMAASIGGTGQ
ncbi:MAG TPA: oligosaccharide flippase family protein [Terracidiphilus sp.]|jgi:O-antigen/teichoic acid export membrane protein